MSHHKVGRHRVRQTHLYGTVVCSSLILYLDIIALLIVGVILVALFVIWQAYLERAEGDSAEIKSMWRPPPLMKLSIWSRADGKLAVMLVVAFLEWCSFLTFVFWVQVSLDR